MNEIKTINFHGDELLAVRHEDGRIFVPMKRVCEAIGLSWGSQYVKLQDKFWSESISIIETEHNPAGSRQELCMNVEFLPMFLAQVRINKVRADIRPKIMLYKEHARKVLADAFLRGEVTTSVDEFADDAGIVMLRQIEREMRARLKLQREVRELKDDQMYQSGRIDGIAEEQAKLASTQKQMISHRRGQDPVPEGTITVRNIRKRYFLGVSDEVIARYLSEIRHPKRPYTYVANQDFQSYCYQEAGLAAIFEAFVADCRFVKETPQRYYCQHPALGNDFAFKKSELSAGLCMRMEEMASGGATLLVLEPREDIE